MFSSDELEYLRELVKREFERFKKGEKISAGVSAVKLLKAEHEYGHFLERLMEKLK